MPNLDPATIIGLLKNEIAQRDQVIHQLKMQVANLPLQLAMDMHARSGGDLSPDECADKAEKFFADMKVRAERAAPGQDRI